MEKDFGAAVNKTDSRKGCPYGCGGVGWRHHPVGAAISCPHLRSWLERCINRICDHEPTFEAAGCRPYKGGGFCCGSI